MDFYLATGIAMFLIFVVPFFLPLIFKSWSVITAVVFLDMLAVIAVIRHIDPSTIKF